MITDAKWIKCKKDTEGAIAFYKTASFDKKVTRALARVSATGVYNFYVNNVKVGNALLAPGCTSLNKRVQCQTYDLSALLSEKAEFSVKVAEGWALGRYGTTEMDVHHVYADHLSVIAEIEIEYADGSLEFIRTDDTWRVRTTEILFSSLYDGEIVDTTAAIEDLGYAVIDTVKKPELVKDGGVIVKEQERIAPIELIITPSRP